jgi:hypothetical protein
VGVDGGVLVDRRVVRRSVSHTATGGKLVRFALLVNWNTAVQSLSKAPPPYEPLNDLLSRCRLSLLQSTPGERALVAAGWIPFRPNGEQLVRGDVEIVGGKTGADGMCRPIVYNVFVFVDSRFSGTLSPDVMTSRVDGASGSVGSSPETTSPFSSLDTPRRIRSAAHPAVYKWDIASSERRPSR